MPTDQGDPTRQPVMRSSVNRVTALPYSLEGEPDTVRAGDFAVAPAGEVYRLAWGYPREGYFILTYDRNARIQERIHLEPSFRALHLAVLPHGGFVVDGMRYEHLTDPVRSCTVLLDAKGQLVRWLRLSQEDGINDAALHNDEHLRGPGSRNVAVDFAQMSTSADGNVQLLRRSVPEVRYVISPDGEELAAVVWNASRDANQGESRGAPRLIIAAATPADFPSFGILPAHIEGMVQVQQQTLAAVQKSEAEDIVVHKGQ